MWLKRKLHWLVLKRNLSSWRKVTVRDVQGSVLGPVSFNIFIAVLGRRVLMRLADETKLVSIIKKSVGKLGHLEEQSARYEIKFNSATAYSYP